MTTHRPTGTARRRDARANDQRKPSPPRTSRSLRSETALGMKNAFLAPNACFGGRRVWA